MSRRGVVLAGAAALGAYEVGVLQYVAGTVAREVGPDWFDVISGTSAGALNAMAIAAFADRPAEGVARLREAWCGLEIGRVLRPSSAELLALLLEAGGVRERLPRALQIRRARGGLLDPMHVARLLVDALPIQRLHDHVRSGLVRAVAISVTQIASGRAVVFHETALPMAPWHDTSLVAIPTQLETAHGLASAAIPVLFPPVSIDGELYCDGGLRQIVPLSPSLHLGARRLLVINPLARARTDMATRQARQDAVTSPLYLAGKALNALFADRTDIDVARVDQITSVLRAGRRRFGPAFDAEINAELDRAGAPPLHEVTTLCIEPSRDLGQLAADYVASASFASRARGITARVIRCLAESGPTRTGDLLSYLLFDGGFAAELIALGHSDARARHAELCELFTASAAACVTTDQVRGACAST